MITQNDKIYCYTKWNFHSSIYWWILMIQSVCVWSKNTILTAIQTMCKEEVRTFPWPDGFSVICHVFPLTSKPPNFLRRFCSICTPIPAKFFLFAGKKWVRNRRFSQQCTWRRSQWRNSVAKGINFSTKFLIISNLTLICLHLCIRPVSPPVSILFLISGLFIFAELINVNFMDVCYCFQELKKIIINPWREMTRNWLAKLGIIWWLILTCMLLWLFLNPGIPFMYLKV